MATPSGVYAVSSARPGPLAVLAGAALLCACLSMGLPRVAAEECGLNATELTDLARSFGMAPRAGSTDPPQPYGFCGPTICNTPGAAACGSRKRFVPDCKPVTAGQPVLGAPDKWDCYDASSQLCHHPLPLSSFSAFYQDNYGRTRPGLVPPGSVSPSVPTIKPVSSRSQYGFGSAALKCVVYMDGKPLPRRADQCLGGGWRLGGCPSAHAHGEHARRDRGRFHCWVAHYDRTWEYQLGVSNGRADGKEDPEDAKKTYTLACPCDLDAARCASVGREALDAGRFSLQAPASVRAAT